jgi:hypothetical protein
VIQCCLRISRLIKERYTGVIDMMAFDTLIQDMMSGNEHAEEAFIQAWHAFVPRT